MRHFKLSKSESESLIGFRACIIHHPGSPPLKPPIREMNVSRYLVKVYGDKKKTIFVFVVSFRQLFAIRLQQSDSILYSENPTRAYPQVGGRGAKAIDDLILLVSPNL